MASTLSFTGLSAKQCISQKVSARQNQKVARVSTVVKAAGLDKGGPYGLCLEMAKTAGKSMQSGKAKVPLELEEGEMPLNTYKNKTPFIGTIKSVERIVGPKATGETTHIIIDHGGKMPFWEGQSYGVIPPGTKINSKGKEVPHGVRLYSIASTRYGDSFDGKTATLCVRRATYWDEEKGAEDPEKKGICSNFLCDAQPGQEVMMTGPTGQVMLLPKDPSTPVIMVATGTGIAPMRSYIRRFFVEDVPSWNFTGLAWLFMGVANSDATLYDDEFQECVRRFPGQFRIDYALSREQNNKKGGKMYIQDKVEEYKDQVFSLLDGGAHMYFCGLKGMMPGILSMLEGVCKEKGIDYEEWLEGLKHKGQWHVEVY
jgi:ferredoxin--NADP+ reductase